MVRIGSPGLRRLDCALQNECLNKLDKESRQLSKRPVDANGDSWEHHGFTCNSCRCYVQMGELQKLSDQHALITLRAAAAALPAARADLSDMKGRRLWIAESKALMGTD